MTTLHVPPGTLVHDMIKPRSRLPRSEERRVGKECRSLCDWSSDVCSSDLWITAIETKVHCLTAIGKCPSLLQAASPAPSPSHERPVLPPPHHHIHDNSPCPTRDSCARHDQAALTAAKIGRASCRERV